MTDSIFQTINEAVTRRYDSEIDRIEHLDNKANTIMGISGVLATLIAGLASLSVGVTHFNLADYATLFTLELCLGFLVLSFGFTLKAHQIRNYVAVPDPITLVAEGEKMHSDEILHFLNVNYALAIDENEAMNNDKAGWLEFATFFILASIILFLIYAFLRMT